MSFKLSFVLKMEFFWKMVKLDELGEILELIGIGLRRGYAYAIVIICNMWLCFVKVFEHVCLAFRKLLRKR